MNPDGTVCVTINSRTLELVLGNIAEQQVDAIVNAANSRLAGGGGVDGAIHRAGGPAIMADTRRRHPDGCPTGSAVTSTAGNLRANYIIHAVGPVWSGGHRGEALLLASAYRASLKLAAASDCRSIALPALSTGAYRYPIDDASQVAIETVVADFRTQADKPFPQLARFVLFSPDVFQAFERALRAALSHRNT
jgi:O-acetyl-ADP-ribose deacetylase (regulator of RNase III)